MSISTTMDKMDRMDRMDRAVHSVHYWALPAQYRFLRSRARYAALFGGVGSGKTHAGCFWALTKALRNPGCLGLVAANSYQQLQDATLRTLRALLAQYRIPHRFSASEMRLCLANGAEVLCRSLESYELLRGVELGWFYLDELRDTREEAWRVVQGRLRSPRADALEGRVTSTPNGFNWMYEEFIRRPASGGSRGLYEAFFARTADNHHLPPEYLEALQASYDPLLAAQELEGRFLATAAGRIYHAFDRALHVSQEAELLPGEPILWSLDFNVNPMTAVIAQMDPPVGGASAPRDPSRGAETPRPQPTPLVGLRVVDELWLTDSGTLAACEAFAAWLEAHDGHNGQDGRGAVHSVHSVHPPLLVFGDAGGRARSTAGRSDWAIIRQCFPGARLCVPAANPPRRDRYNAVNAALCDASGRVRLRIHPRCRHLIEDLEECVYQPGTSLPDTRNPLRGHIADALGYMVARLMPAGAPPLGAGQW